MPACLCKDARYSEEHAGRYQLNKCLHLSRFGHASRLAHWLTNGLDIDCMQALRTLDDVELYRLACLERSVPIHLDS